MNIVANSYHISLYTYLLHKLIIIGRRGRNAAMPKPSDVWLFLLQLHQMFYFFLLWANARQNDASAAYQSSYACDCSQQPYDNEQHLCLNCLPIRILVQKMFSYFIHRSEWMIFCSSHFKHGNLGYLYGLRARFRSSNKRWFFIREEKRMSLICMNMYFSLMRRLSPFRMIRVHINSRNAIRASMSILTSSSHISIFFIWRRVNDRIMPARI